jgi:hypothetical protein
MTVLDKVFTGCAVVGGSLLMVRVVLMFIGGGLDADADVDAHVDFDMDAGADFDVHADFDAAHDFDMAHDLDVAHDIDAHADSTSAFHLLSLHSIMAFLLMFGLVGLTLRKEANAGEALAIGGASVAGLFCFWLMAKMIAILKGLQSSGTVSLANAIGQEGSVYLTIAEGGTGKVEVVVDGRLMFLNARAESGEEIRTGEKVAVVNFALPNILVVEKV